MILQSINPATNELEQEYKEHQWDEVNAALCQAVKAQKEWSAATVESRAVILLKAASLLRQRKEELAMLITCEMGKLIIEARAEIEKCAWVCDYYASEGIRFLSRQNIKTESSESYVIHRPLGIVLAIMPWNFPFWQLFRCAAPSLMAGNGVILKHASNVSGCALAIEQIISDSGVPTGLFKTLLLSGKKASNLISDKRINAISITGSTTTGKIVAMQSAQYLKKCVLELGGSDPYLILADADLDTAVEACVKGRLINAGQSCIAAKRFIIVDQIYNEFEERFVERMRQMQEGDPMDPKCHLGPLARNNIREELHRQVTISTTRGARLLQGGVLQRKTGAFYPATVLANVRPGMPAYDEEFFGPVASLIHAADEAEAVKIANDTAFGLGSAIFSKDIEKARHLAEKSLDAGCCFINDYVKSDPRLPFGGIKESGMGRELSLYGIMEFVNIKTISIR